ncbi:MAG: DeoR/GlpR family DNA-binding transcription regulator [Alphaproteobacteria bacterium]|jgi:DeoR/GlpR family transcriptional regulator of sugar metabolism|nr:DeoR/GlpR family DNA-binding transcription regulator [Alphaproteobacteria bacterium]
MLPIERHKYILDLLRTQEFVRVPELSNILGVTEETIRRDIKFLAQNGDIKKTHGGAMLLENAEKPLPMHNHEDIPFKKRILQNTDLKHKIAALGVSLVKNGDTLMLDASSTTLVLVEYLKQKKNLTFLTNSIEIVYKYANDPIYIISTGGSPKKNGLSLIGKVAMETISQYNVDTLFMGCQGLDLNKGITDSNEPDSTLKRCMMKQAEKIYLLVDSTKFNKVSFAKIADNTEITGIITDSKPSEEWLKYASIHNIEIIY